MRRTNKIDPFFDKQPPLSFVEELKESLHKEKPKYYRIGKNAMDGAASMGKSILNTSTEKHQTDALAPKKCPDLCF